MIIGYEYTSTPDEEYEEIDYDDTETESDDDDDALTQHYFFLWVVGS